LAEASGDPVAQIIAAVARLFVGWIHEPAAHLWTDYLDLVDRGVAATDDPHLRGMAAIHMSWGASATGDRLRFFAALDQIRESATVLSGPRLPTWALWLEAMDAARRGDWRRSIESAAAARDLCFDRVIGANVLSLFLGIAAIHQGTVDELQAIRRGVAADPRLASGVLVRAFTALLAALVGDADAASDELEALLADPLFGDHPLHLPTLGLAARAAARAGDVRTARIIEPLLRPYAGFMAAGGMAEVGSVDALLAALLALEGRHDEAGLLFASGLKQEEDYGAPALAVQTRYWWARSLIEGGRDDDRARADALIEECLATADRLEMVLLAIDARSLID
jgi:hypothetical protein